MFNHCVTLMELNYFLKMFLGLIVVQITTFWFTKKDSVSVPFFLFIFRMSNLTVLILIRMNFYCLNRYIFWSSLDVFLGFGESWLFTQVVSQFSVMYYSCVFLINTKIYNYLCSFVFKFCCGKCYRGGFINM